MARITLSSPPALVQGKYGTFAHAAGEQRDWARRLVQDDPDVTVPSFPSPCARSSRW